MEEAPAPMTPKPEPEEDLQDVKEYSINHLDKNYLIKIGKLNKSEKLVFIVQQNDSLKNYIYQSEFALEDLKLLNKLFRIFDSIDEAYKDISGIKIIEEESNNININLNLTSLSSKTKDICIKIKKNYLNNEKTNEIIFEELYKINSELKEEKLKNENLKKIIDELKIQVKELLDWKNDQLKNKEMALDKDNNIKMAIDSKIIKTKEEIELLSKRLTPKNFNKDGKVSFKLLYRASRDGDSPKDYHYKCDGKKNTLCVIQTPKGCKFGGYTEITINSTIGNFIDPNAFVFSLNNNKIYENLRKGKIAGDHSKDWGPIFRGDAFAVWNKNFLSYDKHTLGTKSQSHFGVMNEDYEINNGEKYFGIEELEVFQIIIE